MLHATGRDAAIGVPKYTVILEGRLDGVGSLPDVADAVMEALLDLHAEDPFVYADATGPTIRAEVVVDAATQTVALSQGVQTISAALETLGVGAHPAVHSPSARAEDLVPA